MKETTAWRSPSMFGVRVNKQKLCDMIMYSEIMCCNIVINDMSNVRHHQQCARIDVNRRISHFAAAFSFWFSIENCVSARVPNINAILHAAAIFVFCIQCATLSITSLQFELNNANYRHLSEPGSFIAFKNKRI